MQEASFDQSLPVDNISPGCLLRSSDDNPDYWYFRPQSSKGSWLAAPPCHWRRGAWHCWWLQAQFQWMRQHWHTSPCCRHPRLYWQAQDLALLDHFLVEPAYPEPVHDNTRSEHASRPEACDLAKTRPNDRDAPNPLAEQPPKKYRSQVAASDSHGSDPFCDIAQVRCSKPLNQTCGGYTPSCKNRPN